MKEVFNFPSSRSRTHENRTDADDEKWWSLLSSFSGRLTLTTSRSRETLSFSSVIARQNQAYDVKFGWPPINFLLQAWRLNHPAKILKDVPLPALGSELYPGSHANSWGPPKVQVQNPQPNSGSRAPVSTDGQLLCTLVSILTLELRVARVAWPSSISQRMRNHPRVAVLTSC